MASVLCLRTLCAALLLTLSACHSDEDIADDTPQADTATQPDTPASQTGDQTGELLSRFNSDGTAWLALHLSMEGYTQTRTAATRAGGDNGTFADATLDEYSVDNAYLLLFAGASEATATFASAYKIDSPSLDGATNPQVDRTTTVAIQDFNIKGTDQLYAFVVLNNNDTHGITAHSRTSVTFANGDSPEKTFDGSSTLTDLQAVVVNSIRNDNDHFTMTNAVMADKPGGTSDPSGATITTLVRLLPSHIFASKDDALANPAVHVNVERLAAKVTVGCGGTLDYHIAGNTDLDFEAADLTYSIDNYNTLSRTVKTFSTSWPTLTTAPGTTSAYSGLSTYHRFVEENAVEANLPILYRTHWAEDVNYDNLTTTLHPYTEYGWQSLSTPAYMAENTFDAAHQTEEHATALMVRLQLNGGNDFYTTRIDSRDIIYKAEANTNGEHGTGAGQSFAPRRSTELTTATEIDDRVRDYLMGIAEVRQWVDKYASGDKSFLKVTMKNNYRTASAAETGRAWATVTQTAYNVSTTQAYIDFDALSSTIDEAIEALDIYYYAQGYCYYRVPIKHFGDELTPWDAPKTAGTAKTAAAYYGSGSTADAAYMGRYGIVRNNCYDLSITAVEHIGEPTPVTATTGRAVDAQDKGLLVGLKVSLLPWQKHEQDI